MKSTTDIARDAITNILAVEYLIKTNDDDTYSRLIGEMYKMDEDDFEHVYIYISLNQHPDTLGSMITHGEYDKIKDYILGYLEHGWT